MAACPYCGTTTRYTDPALQVRCTTCFNPLNDQAPGTPIGRYEDLDAPMVITGTTGTHIYPQPIITKYNRNRS
jgi:hypothetical protein